jgi:phosphohistidine phosphatase
MSTHQLFVLRHAKSSWDDPGLDDHERPLAARGRRATQLLAEHVHRTGIAPAQVLCSNSRRTLETLEGVAPGGESLIEPALYSASGAELLERLRRIPEAVSTAMIVGHNPAMQVLVLKLAGANGDAPVDGELAEVQRKFPTGALATLTFECDWSALAPGCATLESYVRPKSLQ